MAIFQNIREKGVAYMKDDAFFYAILFILLGVTSFGLGRQSVTVESSTQRNFSQATTIQSASERTKNSLQKNTPTQYVGSKNSDKYHLLWCTGAKRIAEENKIYFDSKEEAVQAGYSPAGNCKGM